MERKKMNGNYIQYALLVVLSAMAISLLGLWLVLRSERGAMQKAMADLGFEPNSPALSAQRLTEVAREANSELYVLCGSCDPSVYSEAVANELMGLARRGATVTIVAGPKLNMQASGNDPIVNAKRTLESSTNSDDREAAGRMVLRALPYYPADGHFRVADRRHYCVEMPHVEGAPRNGRMISRVVPDPVAAGALAAHFEKLIDNSEELLGAVRSGVS
jgi:hypothetical protein